MNFDIIDASLIKKDWRGGWHRVDGVPVSSWCIRTIEYAGLRFEQIWIGSLGEWKPDPIYKMFGSEDNNEKILDDKKEAFIEAVFKQNFTEVLPIEPRRILVYECMGSGRKKSILERIKGFL